MGVKLYLVLEETFRKWSDDYVMRQAAAISFYVLLTTVPLVMVLISVGGAALQDVTADGTIISRIAEVAGEEAANLVESIVRSVASAAGSTSATVVTVIIALYASTAAFANLRATLDQMWDVPEAGAGVKGFVIRRAVAFVFMVVLGGLLIASVFVFRLLATLGETALSVLGFSSGAFSLVFDDFAIFVAFVVVFMLMYRLLPHRKLPWRDVAVGAAVTAALYMVGEWGLSIYFSRGSHTSVYGAAGAIVVSLLWLYYSWVVVLTSAEFTYAWSRRAELWKAGNAGDVTLKEAVRRSVRDR